MIMPEPAPPLVVIVTTAGSTLASTSRTWLPLATGGAELDADADVLAGTVVGRTTVVLLPRVAARTPPLTLAPMRAATAATIHNGAARFGRGGASCSTFVRSGGSWAPGL